jgi:heterodisulfide reductase subunit C
MLKKPFFSGGSGKDQFLEAYQEDHLFPLIPEWRDQLKKLQGCISCGLCDSACPTLEQSKGYMFYAPSDLASSLTRDLTTYELLNDYLRIWQQCSDCHRCESICPTKVPLRELATFVRAINEANSKR